MLVEIAPLVVADEVRADILVTRSFCRLRLVLKTLKERHGDVLLEVDARKLRDHLLAQVFGERLISDAKHIKTNTIE